VKIRQRLAENLPEQFLQTVCNGPLLEIVQREDRQDELARTQLLVEPATVYKPLQETHRLADNATLVAAVINDDESKIVSRGALFNVEPLARQTIPAQRKVLTQLGVGDEPSLVLALEITDELEDRQFLDP